MRDNLYKLWNAIHFRANDLNVKQATSLTRRSPKDAVDLIRIKKKIQDHEISSWVELKVDIHQACTVAIENTSSEEGIVAIEALQQTLDDLIPLAVPPPAPGTEFDAGDSSDEREFTPVKDRTRKTRSSVESEEQALMTSETEGGVAPSRRRMARARSKTEESVEEEEPEKDREESDAAAESVDGTPKRRTSRRSSRAKAKQPESSTPVTASSTRKTAAKPRRLSKRTRKSKADETDE